MMRRGGLAALLVWSWGCAAPAAAPPPVAAPVAPEPPAADDAELEMLPSGLGFTDLAVGRGPAASRGDRVTVHFVGRLEDGRPFDSTHRRQQPFRFVLGDPGVLEGFNEGVTGMRVGGRRRLFVPPTLGYGAAGAPPDIPPGAFLEFEVELLAAERP